MPKDNIERAIAKGTGEGGEADAIEAVLYEGYGPGGVAVLVEALTDNRNRTGADVRHAFSKSGGSLGEPGSVAYLFDKKGTIVIDADALLRRRPDGRGGGRRRGHLHRRGRLRGGRRAGATSAHVRKRPRGGRRGDGERRDGLPALEPRAGRGGARRAG